MLWVYGLLLCLHLAALVLQDHRSLDGDDEAEIQEAHQQWVFAVFGCLWLLGMASPFFYVATVPVSESLCLSIGLVLFALGFLIRILAYRNLDKMFTYALGLRQDHALVTSGIHSLVRHPGYVGTLIIHLGLTLASGSWLAMLLTIGSIAIVLRTRVKREEALLASTFGAQWTRYAQNTGRWFPNLSARS